MSGLGQKSVLTGEFALQWQRFKPFKLLSLLDMLPFLAIDVIRCRDKFDSLHKQCALLSKSNKAMLIPNGYKEKVEACILPLKPHLDSLRMDRTFERVCMTEQMLASVEVKFDLSELTFQLREIILAMNADLGSKRFFYLPIEKTKFYQQDDFFGIKTKFPQANAEIILAGNCYATGNNTACVFHLMRAVEIGTKTMVSALGAQKHIFTTVFIDGNKTQKEIPIELCDWQKLIDGMQKSLQELEKGISTDSVRKATYIYYKTAINTFSYFKDAWRNIISHTHTIGDTDRTTYLPGETADILRETGRYLQQLAKRLTEE